MTEGGSASSVVLVHSKEIENHKNECRDVTSLEWNVSHLWVLRGPSYARLMFRFIISHLFGQMW